MLSSKEILNNLSLIGLIKTGSSGSSVYAAKHDKTSQLFAIKFLTPSPLKKSVFSCLSSKRKRCSEGATLQNLQKIEGIPKLFYFGEPAGCNSQIIVTELLGNDLSLEFFRRNQWFPKDFLKRLGESLVDLLQKIHEKNYVHCDISPENIAISLEEGQKTEFFLVDFGETRSLLKKPAKKLKETCRNLEFMACERHFSEKSLEKAHDLESLGYVLLYFSQGFLPWEIAEPLEFSEKNSRIAARKQFFLENELENLQNSLREWFVYLRTMNKREKIDYFLLRKLAGELRNDLDERSDVTSETKGRESTSFLRFFFDFLRNLGDFLKKYDYQESFFEGVERKVKELDIYSKYLLDFE